MSMSGNLEFVLIGMWMQAQASAARLVSQYRQRPSVLMTLCHNRADGRLVAMESESDAKSLRLKGAEESTQHQKRLQELEAVVERLKSKANGEERATGIWRGKGGIKSGS